MTELDPTETRRPRAGRRFEPIAERDLIRPALCAAQTLPGAREGLHVLQEVAGPFGVADFIAIVGATRRVEARLALDVPPLLNEVDAGIVAVTSPHHGRTPARLAELLGWPVASIDRRLPGLLKSGAVRELRRGRFVRPDSLVPIGRAYAIETKMRQWRRALRQARTYRLWCDNYVIVMPALSRPVLVEALAKVEKDSGGLFVDGRWEARPRLRRAEPARRVWGSEHLVAALRGPELPPLGDSEPAEAVE
jgi:hypothetical protein